MLSKSTVKVYHHCLLAKSTVEIWNIDSAMDRQSLPSYFKMLWIIKLYTQIRQTRLFDWNFYGFIGVTSDILRPQSYTNNANFWGVCVRLYVTSRTSWPFQSDFKICGVDHSKYHIKQILMRVTSRTWWPRKSDSKICEKHRWATSSTTYWYPTNMTATDTPIHIAYV